MEVPSLLFMEAEEWDNSLCLPLRPRFVNAFRFRLTTWSCSSIQRLKIFRPPSSHLVMLAVRSVISQRVLSLRYTVSPWRRGNPSDQQLPSMQSCKPLHHLSRVLPLSWGSHAKRTFNVSWTKSEQGWPLGRHAYSHNGGDWFIHLCVDHDPGVFSWWHLILLPGLSRWLTK